MSGSSRCNGIIEWHGGVVQCQLDEHGPDMGHYHEFDDDKALGWDGPVHPDLGDLLPGQAALIRKESSDA